MKRLATVSAAAVLLTVVLAGCDQNMVLGPAAIQRRGSDLIVAVCRSIDAASVTLDTWASGLGTPTQVVLEATGNLHLPAGSEFSTSDPPDGLVVATHSSPAMGARDNFTLQILSVRSSEQDINATFTLGNSGLSESLWLHPDGRETAEPCY